MSNEVTKEMLDESLASIKLYLDNTSVEDIMEGMREIGGFTQGGVPAAEVIDWEGLTHYDLLDDDLRKVTLSPEDSFRRVNGEWDKVGNKEKIMSKFEDIIKQGILDNRNFIVLEGNIEERKKKLIEKLVPFDKDRLQKAIDSGFNLVPEGLSTEETREFILSKGKKTDE